MMFRNFLFLILILKNCQLLSAQDTLHISVEMADSMFISNNFSLLASSLNLDAQKALIVQAKLYPNPIFSADFNAYDPQNKKVLHTGNSGQKAAQIEQLFLLGGKYKAQIQLAKTNAAMAELEFYNLLRQLKFQLHSNMYFLSQQSLLIEKYNAQLRILDTILVVHDVQARKGNIPLKDVVRLKGAYLQLLDNRSEVYRDYFDGLAKVQTILQTDKIVVPTLTENDYKSAIQEVQFDQLLETAFNNRMDYQLTVKNLEFSKQYYTLQKKLAIPDMSVFSSYDQRGGAFQNQLNVGVSIPLPLWNRNQGNIKSADAQIKQRSFEIEAAKVSIKAEVQNYFSVYKTTIQEYQKTMQLYNEDFDITLKGISANFQKGNVSLLEFVDFFEGYNNAMAEIARIKVALAISSEQLALSTGK